jgi:dolichol-phosphate mannosyltransferase
MVRFAGDAIVSFSYAPLRLVTTLGLVVSAASFSYAVYAVLARLFDWDVVQGWASLMVAVLFLGGVQLVAIGIIGEYLGRVYDEVKGRPLYFADVHPAGQAPAAGSASDPGRADAPRAEGARRLTIG